MALDTECLQCQGTGVYRGFAELKGVGVVCLECKGTGKKVMRYIPFTRRKIRRDVRTVRRSQGSFIATGVGPTGGGVSYQEFLNGKLP